MAHDLMMDPITGEACMFFYGKLPWHGLGQELKEQRPATAAEAIRLAHLDWQVKKYPAYARIGDKFVPVEGYNATVREDTINTDNPVSLGVVGSTYEPLQNVDAFSFFDAIVGKGSAIYETAGALRLGDRIWILAKLPGDFAVIGDDIINQYLFLSNSHDGSSAVTADFTDTRIVCNNTLSIATRNSSARRVKIRHTQSAKDKLAEAGRLMGIVNREFADRFNVYKSLTLTSMTQKSLKTYFETLYRPPVPDAETGKIPERTEDNHRWRMQTLTRLFEAGPGMNIVGVKGTLWAAYNAVTDYVDHYNRGQDADKRLDSLMWGAGHRIKEQALELAAFKQDSWM